MAIIASSPLASCLPLTTMSSASAAQTSIQILPSDSCEPVAYPEEKQIRSVCDYLVGSEIESVAAMREDKSFKHERSEQITIPDEILLVIFRDALPPSWRVYYHKNLAPFHRSFVSSDLETKLTIIQVCKTWYRIGLEFLYESVVLHSIGQLPSFVMALEARPSVGSFVRRLEIDYWVPQGYNALHEAEIQKAFQLCRNLTHFAFNPLVVPYTQLYHLSLPSIPTSPANSLLGITHLEIGSQVAYDSILLLALLQLSPILESLSHPILTFPSLRVLRLWCSWNTTVPVTPSDCKWVTPRLEHLVVHPPWLTEMVALSDYCPTLLSLCLPWANLCSSVATLLSHCPQLQHLMINDREPIFSDGTQVVHEYLQFLYFTRTKDKLDESYWKAKFPALRRCQYLDGSYDLCPEMGGVKVDHSLSASSYVEFLSSYATSEDDSSDDSDYVPHSEDSDDTSRSDSASDGPSDYEEYFNPDRINSGASFSYPDEQDGEIEREEAVAIFRHWLLAKRERQCRV
ncbi:hypothetical protein R3P38DRAFT_3257813 [Favolaschia claudopus]|uniref:F-box domain-containing protein n=1 Tax=Favolaschia claudopus TaxID=2862362 RepID=A0AAW0D1R9_9AGAR